MRPKLRRFPGPTLEDYERGPGFKERSAEIEAEMRAAMIMGKEEIGNLSEIARRLGVPDRHLHVMAEWLARFTTKYDVDHVSITIRGLPQ